MAKKAKKGNGTAKVAVKPEQPQDAKKAKSGDTRQSQGDNRQPLDLVALRKPVLAAKAKLETAEAEAKSMVQKAEVLVDEAKAGYREALAPYREACRKAGVQCEFEAGRSTNVSPKVSFIIEKADKGIRVMVKGKPDSEELIPIAALKASVNKAAYAYYAVFAVMLS